MALADQLRTKGQSSPSFAAEALHLAALSLSDIFQLSVHLTARPSMVGTTPINLRGKHHAQGWTTHSRLEK